MIFQEFPSTRKKSYSYTPSSSNFHNGTFITAEDREWAAKKKIPVAEYITRKNSLMKQIAECGYSVGDIVVPATPAGQREYKKFKVTDMIKHYKDVVDTEDWRDGLPFVIELEVLEAVKPTQNGTYTWCTINFIKKDTNAAQC